MDEILRCDHSNETSSAVLSHGTIYLVCSSNFWVCGWNLGVSNQLKPPKQYCHMVLLVCLFVFSHSLLCGQRATSKLFSFRGVTVPEVFAIVNSTQCLKVANIKINYYQGEVNNTEPWLYLFTLVTAFKAFQLISTTRSSVSFIRWIIPRNKAGMNWE